MKRIEVKLSLPVVAPLLDLIKAVVGDLGARLAASQHLQDLDEELRTAWQADLLGGRNDDCRRFLALFDREFFVSGNVGFDEANAESVLRACAAIRLQVRERELKSVPDDVLEGGGVDVSRLNETTAKAFMCYVFLATLQELIIRHLDSAILDG
jgi:hypothetical protein